MDYIIDVDYDISAAEAKTKRLNRQYEEQRKLVKEAADEAKKTTDYAAEQKAALDGVNERYKEELSKLSQLKGEAEKIPLKTDENIRKHDELKAKIAEVERAVAATRNEQREQAAEVERSEAAAKKATNQYNKQYSRLESIGIKIKENTDKSKSHAKSWLKTNRNIQKSQTSVQQFGKRIGSLVKSALIFSVLTKGLTELREAFSNLITKEGTKTAELIKKLKGNLKTIGITLYESTKPYIEWLLQRLIELTQILTKGLSKILGKNISQMAELASKTEEAGEEAKKATAGFDTIQTIDTSSQESATSSGRSTSLDFSALDQPISDSMARIYAIVSGALLVLGIILTLTGTNIPLGLGLIAVGAVALAGVGQQAWDSLPRSVQRTISEIFAVVSTGLLVIGVILAFSGAAIGLGIALIVLGAVGIATTVTNWDDMPNQVQETITNVMAIGGLLLLMLGIILTCIGIFPLGIALIVVGAAGLVGAIALNWNAITDKVKGIASAIGNVFVNLWNDIKNGFWKVITFFSDGWKTIKKKFKDAAIAVGNAVSGAFKSAINWVLEKAISIINGFISGINFAIGIINKIPGVSIKKLSKLEVPKLATGAVIPGGSPFLAMLGDQPKGKTNIEAPLDTLVEAFKAAQGTQTFTIQATGSMAPLIRMLNLKVQQENNRASVF